MSPPRRWLFADQLGPHFVDDVADAGVLLVESRAVFRRRRWHRRKAHVVLSALRHRAAELGDRCVLVSSETYRQGVEELGERVEVCAPTSRAADALVRRLDGVDVLPARGWVLSRDEFAAWASGRRRLLLEDYYRDVRRRLGVLVEPDGSPLGGRWNFDADNRQPPPRRATRLSDVVDLPEPWWPVEDDIDAGVRETLDRWERDDGIEFVGHDGPRRFAVTHDEARAAAEHFATRRLAAFGAFEDAMLADDPWMAHSLLSVPLNLGLLDPVDLVRRAERAYHEGQAGLAATEGFVRQVIGWREYVWHVYWHTDPDYRHRNALGAHRPLPDWFADLDADAVTARCLSEVLTDVREQGWAHHIPRLMVLGSWALQRGYDPAALTEWFHTSFVDGYDWVMLPNVVGMSQHADGGLMATKPYTSGGAYINRMSDYCRGCPYDPSVRVGEKACPFTAGYWAFLHDNRERLSGNHRMAQLLRGLDRLADLPGLLAQESARGDGPP
ncbi:MAG: cryptochrome/photolyase family protein [Jiangellales bacterium]